MSFNEISHPTARKSYRCEWCRGPIPVGETHVGFVGVWEGEFQNWRMHEECYEDADMNGCLSEGFMPGDGEMPERVRKMVSSKGRQP